MKFLFWVICTNKGNGRTNIYLDTNYETTTDLKQALKFVDKPSAQAIFKKEKFTLKDWIVLDVTYQLKDVVKPKKPKKDKFGKRFFDKGKNESIKKPSS